MRDIPESSNRGSSKFRGIVACFLLQPGLPFAGILSAERIERVFKKQSCLFGAGGIYSVAVVLWSFLSQVLRDGKEASCQAAVARITAFKNQRGEPAPTSDTGDYCRARSKLSEAALHELTVEIGAEVEVQCDPKWLWKERHAKLVDGFTFTMPDTVKNQASYPSPRTQKKGVGLPIARVAAILSLASACILDLAIGPYKGKETGETALLRELLTSFQQGDIAVMDRYYCSFMMIALLWGHGVDVCTRIHHLRKVDFRRGRRLGHHDHVLHWTRPQRPDWMDQETYEKIPKTLQLREIRYSINQPGFRTKSFDVVTTLLDENKYSKDDIAQLYGFRWNSELDIRSIKQSLNLDHVRCKSPEMVHKELWTTLLAYNLIRTTAAASAALHETQPREISFTATCQYILSIWMLRACEPMQSECSENEARELLKRISECRVANRPGRVEPRVIKRRQNQYDLMQEPRHVLKARLLGL
jgi:hypothetical protein